MKQVVLETGGIFRGSAAGALQAMLERQPGVHHADVNPVSQTATVAFDEAAVSEADLRRLVQACGYHCRGEVVPSHVCAPADAGRAAPGAGAAVPDAHAGHAVVPERPAHGAPAVSCSYRRAGAPRSLSSVSRRRWEFSRSWPATLRAAAAGSSVRWRTGG
jgi:Cu2+-exporting ATPase